jgi:hypothetical protein
MNPRETGKDGALWAVSRQKVAGLAGLHHPNQNPAIQWRKVAGFAGKMASLCARIGGILS